MSFRQNNIFKLIRRFNFSFPSLTTKKLVLKEKSKKPFKRFFKKTIFSKVYTQKLIAKQQLKNIYGVNEHHLKQCISLAFICDKTNNNGLILNIYNILEKHLYFILFKKGFAKTIKQAKQMISHKKIFVNSFICNKTNYICRKNDFINFKFLNKNICFSIKDDEKNLSFKNSLLISRTLEFFK